MVKQREFHFLNCLLHFNQNYITSKEITLVDVEINVLYIFFVIIIQKRTIFFYLFLQDAFQLMELSFNIVASVWFSLTSHLNLLKRNVNDLFCLCVTIDFRIIYLINLIYFLSFTLFVFEPFFFFIELSKNTFKTLSRYLFIREKFPIYNLCRN